MTQGRQKKSSKGASLTSDSPPSIDLHGVPPDEVEDRLKRFIEDSRRKKVPFIRIIHGKGKGILREQVRTILALSRHVDSYADGPDWGSTGVHLKPHH